MALFQGLSAFPITPTDAAGIVDTAALTQIVERLVAAEVDSIGLLGSTGSYVYLRREQRRRAVEVAVEVVNGRVPLMVGVGAFRTDQAIALAQDAEAAGADALLLAPVSYIPLSQVEVFTHFSAVAGATGLPLCIYNNPTATHFTFSDDLLVKLSHLAGIGGVKMPSPSKEDVAGELARLRPQVPADFKIGYSRDSGSADAVARGGAAWYSGMAGVLPNEVLKLCRAAQARDRIEVDRMNGVFAPLWELCASLGTLRVVYAIANALELFDGHPLRPMLPLTDTERSLVKSTLSNLSQL